MEKIEVSNKTVAVVYNGTLYFDEEILSALSGQEHLEIVKKVHPLHVMPHVLCKSFKQEASLAVLKKKVLSGEDASLGLALAGVKVSSDYVSAVADFKKAVEPVLEALDKLRPEYPLAEVPSNVRHPVEYGPRWVTRNGYAMSVNRLATLWSNASKRWKRFHNGEIKRFSTTSDYIESKDIQNSSARNVYIYSDRIEIGCQTILRYEIEQAALHYGWEFPA